MHLSIFHHISFHEFIRIVFIKTICIYSYAALFNIEEELSHIASISRKIVIKKEEALMADTSCRTQSILIFISNQEI